MLHAKFQDHRTSGSGEEDFQRFLPYIGLLVPEKIFKGFLPYMDMAAILVM